MTQSETINKDKEGSFMLPIWLITIASMAGTLLVSYAVHSYYLDKAHKDNMQQVEMTEFRTYKYTEYKNILEKDGKEAAANYLNNQQ